MRVIAKYDSDPGRLRRIPTHSRDRAMAMLRDGLTPQEVAARYGTTTREVRRLARKMGVNA